MKITYARLWQQLLDRKIKKKDLEQQAGITHYALLQMGRDEPVSLEMLAKVCDYLDCGLDDIVQVIPEIDETTFC